MQTNGKRVNQDTKNLVYLAILSALVVILQIVSNVTGGILIVPITLTLVPIVLGGALVNKWSGALLGLVFALAVLFTGAANAFLAVNFVGTVVTVIVKGVLSGLFAGLIYSALEKVNKYLAILIAGIVAPVTNTGIFIIGCYVFFYDYVLSLAGGEGMFIFVITVFAGVNFLVELGLNMLLSPAILRIVNIKSA